MNVFQSDLTQAGRADGPLLRRIRCPNWSERPDCGCALTGAPAAQSPGASSPRKLAPEP